MLKVLLKSLYAGNSLEKLNATTLPPEITAKNRVPYSHRTYSNQGNGRWDFIEYTFVYFKEEGGVPVYKQMYEPIFV